MPKDNKAKEPKVLKSEAAIFKAMPEITEKHLEEINKAFTPYLFYEDDNKNGIRKCWCSSCRQYFEYPFVQRTEDTKHYEFITATHNKYGVCPKCGQHEQFKQTGRAKECRNLEEWKRFVVILPKGKNQVFFRCYYACKNYSNRDYMCEPTLYESTRYYLAPGVARKWKYEYDYTYLGLSSQKFEELKSTGEPFTKTWFYNISFCEKRGYKIIGENELQKTFLKYSCLRLYKKYYPTTISNYQYYGLIEIPIIKYLCSYAKFPCIEIMMKLGLEKFVDRLVDCNQPMKRYINWGGRTPQEVFKMSTEQFNDLRKHCEDIDDFKAYQALKKAGCKVVFEKIRELNEKFEFLNVEKLATKIKNYNLNLMRVLNYLEKQKKKKDDYPLVMTQFIDYLDFAKKLEYDLSKEVVIFPKKLKEAHDNASANVTAMLDEAAFKKYQKRYEKLEKLYKWTDGEYEIVVPMGINDIIREGKILSHCVGGYAERHVNGKATILFMRKCSDLVTPLVTIEIIESEKRIKQNYGKNNKKPKPKEQAFIDKWLNWVKAGSKRKKNTKNNDAAA